MDDKEDIKQQQQQTPETAGEERKKPMQLTQAIREQAREEDALPSASYTLRKILGGDFLTADVMRKQTGVIILVAFFTMIYVSNRYSCQQDMIEINELKKELNNLNNESDDKIIDEREYDIPNNIGDFFG